MAIAKAFNFKNVLSFTYVCIIYGVFRYIYCGYIFVWLYTFKIATLKI